MLKTNSIDFVTNEIFKNFLYNVFIVEKSEKMKDELRFI